MNAVAYITTRNHKADAAYLSAQGLRITVETDPDGTPFLALTVPNGHLHYVNPGDAIVCRSGSAALPAITRVYLMDGGSLQKMPMRLLLMTCTRTPQITKNYGSSIMRGSPSEPARCHPPLLCSGVSCSMRLEKCSGLHCSPGWRPAATSQAAITYRAHRTSRRGIAVAGSRSLTTLPSWLRTSA